MRRDVFKRGKYLDIVKRIPIIDLCDIDEMASGDDQFVQKMAWCRKGRRFIKLQIVIGGKHYSVIAAYCLFGFICWSIIEGSYTGEHFAAFLAKLAPMLHFTSFGIIDNSSTHKTPDALHTLNSTFRGQYLFSTEYSPDLKPIEKGFSQVKRWIRRREDDATRDPVGTINSAFELYSTTGEKSSAARGNWKIYFSNSQF